MNKLDSHVDSRKTTSRPLLDPSHPEHSKYTRRVAKLAGSILFTGLALFGAEKLIGGDSLPQVDGTNISVVDVYGGSNEHSSPQMIADKGDGSTNIIGAVAKGEIVRITNPVEATAMTSAGDVTMIGTVLPGSSNYVWFNETDLMKQGLLNIVSESNDANSYTGLADTKIENNKYMFQNPNGQYTQAGTSEILPAE